MSSLLSIVQSRAAGDIKDSQRMNEDVLAHITEPLSTHRVIEWHGMVRSFCSLEIHDDEEEEAEDTATVAGKCKHLFDCNWTGMKRTKEW